MCHVGELALPTCERPDASQPGPLPFSWDRAAQVAMETGGLWLLRGSIKEGVAAPAVVVALRGVMID